MPPIVESSTQRAAFRWDTPRPAPPRVVKRVRGGAECRDVALDAGIETRRDVGGARRRRGLSRAAGVGVRAPGERE